MKKGIRILLLFIGVILVLAVLGKSTGILGGKSRVRVDTIGVKRGVIAERISASGTIYPEEELKISPDVSGEITKLWVEEGDSVEAGQLLAKIRPDNYENALERQEALLLQSKAQLSQSQSNLASARANFIPSEMDYKRKQQLFDEEIISSTELEQSEAEYNVRKQAVISAQEAVNAQQHRLHSTYASVREAQENLRLTNLEAPMRGIITKLLVKEGERVVGTSQMAGTTMFHIGNLKEIDLYINVIENDVIRIHVGDSADVELESYAYLNKVFKGRVTAVATSAIAKGNVEEVTEFQVKVRVLRESYQSLADSLEIQHPLRPGMTASVEIYTDAKENAVIVPRSAVTIQRRDLSRRGKGDNGENLPFGDLSSKKRAEIVYAYNPSEETVKATKVKTGLNGLEYIEILEGIEENDIIVSGPPLAISRKLKDGIKVRLRKKKKPSSPR